MTWFGVLVLFALGLPLTVLGLLGVGTSLGRGLLCGGLVLLVSAAGGVAREVVEAGVRRSPPEPRLGRLDGEPALHLSRAPGPTLVSSWSLVGIAAVAVLGAVSAALVQDWTWTGVLGAVAAWLAWTSGVHRGPALAGGVWLTPTRLRHEDRGWRVEVPWEAVTGVVPQQPVPVLLRSDVRPDVERTGPRGRAWSPISRDGTTLLIDAQHLPGESTLVSYVIAKAVTDPASRSGLGSPESLPPA